MRFLIGVLIGLIASIVFTRKREQQALAPLEWGPGTASTETVASVGAPVPAREPGPAAAAPSPASAAQAQAGQQPGVSDDGRARESKLAELRQKYQWLMSFSDDEIRTVALLDAGQELEPWEQYLVVCHREQGVLRPTHAFGKRVPEGHVYLAQHRVPEATWYRLVRAAQA